MFKDLTNISICFSHYLFNDESITMTCHSLIYVCLSVRLSLCLSVCLSVCLFTFVHLLVCQYVKLLCGLSIIVMPVFFYFKTYVLFITVSLCWHFYNLGCIAFFVMVAMAWESHTYYPFNMTYHVL